MIYLYYDMVILTQYDPTRGVSVATLSYDYAAGFKVPEHAHGSDQLIYAIRGLMEVSSGKGMWLIPPHFALWIPAQTIHKIRMPRTVSMRTLYFRPGLVPFTPAGGSVLHVTPLLRELIVESARIGRLRARNVQERALRDLIIVQLKKSSPVPTFITLPTEARALSVARTVLSNPALSKTLSVLCTDVGVSIRTVQRIFKKEVGINFESWRSQVRLTKAVELMIAGSSVKEVAFAVGYHQASPFVEVFRRTFGTTPKAWILGLGKSR